MANAKFDVGRLVRHRLFSYRGAIFGVDPMYATEKFSTVVTAVMA